MKKATSKDDSAKKRNPAKTINEYLAGIPDEFRSALEHLRQTIKSVAPNAEECISYQMPAFKYFGPLVYFAAFKNHCSLFPASSSIIAAFKDELKPYVTTKGSIHFTADHPLPDDLVKKLVEARMRENEARKRR